MGADYFHSSVDSKYCLLWCFQMTLFLTWSNFFFFKFCTQNSANYWGRPSANPQQCSLCSLFSSRALFYKFQLPGSPWTLTSVTSTQEIYPGSSIFLLLASLLDASRKTVTGRNHTTYLFPVSQESLLWCLIPSFQKIIVLYILFRFLFVVFRQGCETGPYYS